MNIRKKFPVIALLHETGTQIEIFLGQIYDERRDSCPHIWQSTEVLLKNSATGYKSSPFRTQNCFERIHPELFHWPALKISNRIVADIQRSWEQVFRIGLDNN